MFQTRITCPYCNNLADFTLTAVAEFQVIAQEQARPSPQPRQMQVQTRVMTPSMRVRAYGVAGCPFCHGPVLIDFEASYQELANVQVAVQRSDQRYSLNNFKILATHPTPQKPSRDPAYPDEIREIFAEAQEDLALKRSPARIVATCRSVLDVCTQKLGGVGNQLSSRIDNLRAQGALTQALADWAHAVRIDGNEAIHELSATEHEARELVEFIKMFLDVAFVLPKRIAERRQAV